MDNSEAELGSVSYFEAGPSGNSKIVKVFFSTLLKINPRVFCEVGASDGSISRAVKKAMPSTSVYAFEPNPSRYNENLELNLSADIKWLPLAVSNSVGPATLRVPIKLGEAYVSDGVFQAGVYEESLASEKSSLLPRRGDCQYHNVEVCSTTLDAFMADELATPGDLGLWVDVEGLGWQVLDGAGSVLERTSVLFLELETVEFWREQKLAKDVLELLSQYELYPFCRDKEYGESQFNVLFLKPNFCDSLLDCIPSVINSAPKSTSFLVSPKSYEDSRPPVIVPCFNNPTHSGSMLRQLQDKGFQEIYFVDNCSSNPSMLEFLESISHKGVNVVRVGSNIGPVESVKYMISRFPDWEVFFVTDPDLEFNSLLPQDFVECLLKQTEYYGIGKAGFALDISSRRKFGNRRVVIGGAETSIREWESQFWKNRVGYTSHGSPIYRAEIDTTFALYNRKYFSFDCFLSAVRIAGIFTARHLPWEDKDADSSPELKMYRATQRFSTYNVDMN
jgi:FkbM family methyltransferase